MIGTDWQKQVLRARREQRDMKRAGWEYLGEGGGKIWELVRGSRIGKRIVQAKVASDGIGVWVLVE